ncbi:MAG: T9SS sorting signal type C domain-containing protein [Sphingobacteriaceae bacterium]|nr:MAG: T9SS sorting signal type C domain-containing protein [Sphingobacteriaceae bacterium]
MKKALFLLFLLPFIGFSQEIDLVKWTGIANWSPSTVPTVMTSNVTAANITGLGNFSNSHDNFQLGQNPNTTSIDVNKYIQISLNSNTTNAITLNKLKFQYKGNLKNYEIRYSKNANFTNPQTLVSNGNAITNLDWSPYITVPFNNVQLLSGEKIYIRFYAYNSVDQYYASPWFIRTSNGDNPNVLTVTGTLATTPPLSGTYTVGAAASNPYKKISDAVAAVNNIGVAGPVTFLLVDDVYNNTTGEVFPITITNFAGSSATNTVTFKPAADKDVKIEAFRQAASATDLTLVQTQSVFKLNGADNIIFDGSNVVGGTTRNLTIQNSSYNSPDSNDRTVIWVSSPTGTNGSVNNTFKYLNIRQTVKNGGFAYCMGIFSGGTTLTGAATAANSGLTVLNNDFQNVKQGVYVNGYSVNGNTSQSELDRVTKNVVIHQNDLGSENNSETIIQPVWLNNVDTFEYTENLVYNLIRETTSGALVSAGVYVSGESRNGQILKNDIRDLEKTVVESYIFGGIVLSSTIMNSNILVANNFINNVSTIGNSHAYLNGHGIVVTSGGGYKIYHNTVSLTKNQTSSTINFSAALYVENATGLDVRNNIFANNQTNTATRRTAIMVKAGNINTVFSNLDYNAYNSNGMFGYIGTDPDDHSPTSTGYKPTFADWKTATSKDANSINQIPVFVSPTDLHLSSTGNNNLDNKGTNALIAVVAKDIDGQLRNTSTPDMGADEFGALVMPQPGTNAGIYCAASTTFSGYNTNGSAIWSNGMPSADKDVIFTADYTQSGGTLNACSIFVEGNAKVNFIGHSNAVVVHNVNVAPTAKLTFESSSNLMQDTNTQNIGNVTVKRNSGLLKRQDYTMWSSPVSGTQTLENFSQNTLTTRFYTFDAATNLYVHVDPTATTFKKAQSYLIRMPNGHSTPGYVEGTARIVFNGEFVGTPNNGNVSIPLSYAGPGNPVATPTRGFNSVGNPYPSPIRIKDFITANLDNISGTIYIWRKTNNDAMPSYATCNLTGYVGNHAPGGEEGLNDGNELIANPWSIAAGGILNAGQGFIVKATGANKNLTFRNNMRRKINFDNFFRNAAGEEETENDEPVFSRYWLNVKGSADVFSQALVAYSTVGTNGIDNGYDSETFTDGEINIYSVAEATSLSIQTRPEFNTADIVKLGFKSAVAGTFEISLDNVDGEFAGAQAIIIKDNQTGAMHNLKDSAYSFTTDAGIFNDRLEVVYVTEALGTDTPVVATKDVIIYRNAKQVNVKAPKAIESVVVYDMLGRIVYEKNNIGTSEVASSELNTAQQVVIVKVTLDNQQVISKKIMWN